MSALPRGSLPTVAEIVWSFLKNKSYSVTVAYKRYFGTNRPA
jgi:hypothetical protein